MKTFTYIKHFLFTTVCLPLLSIIFCAHSLAAIDSNISKEKQVKPPLLSIKNYQNQALSVEFRYINGTLHFIRFLNVSQIPMELHVLDMDYILGPSDAVTINAPHVKYLSVSQKPYAIKTSMFSNMMSNPLSKTQVYAIKSNDTGG